MPSSYLYLHIKYVVNDANFLRKNTLFAEKAYKQWKLGDKGGEEKDERKTEIGAFIPTPKRTEWH